jgi:integrase
VRQQIGVPFGVADVGLAAGHILAHESAQFLRLGIGHEARAKRACNTDVRQREYLTPKEVDRLIKTARSRGRYGSRDGLAILVTYRHGLRASELAGLRWDQVDSDHGLLHVRRLKHGMESVHPLSGDELRALRALRPS